jgi:ubiquinone/menaquinone biosynthesis C-methylase UbiE
VSSASPSPRPPSDAGGWQPRESLNLASRRGKARKVRALLRSWRPLEGARILEIGTGAGVAAELLASSVGPTGRVVAVDVTDLRRVTGGYEFHLVAGTALPFADAAFDIVISSLVIEHVGGGDRDAQREHLAQIHRVLAPGGLAYLAFPNRWGPVEPHFGVPALSWLPVRWRTPYLRRTGRGQVYDILPLAHGEAVALCRAAGFRPVDCTHAAMRAMAAEEDPWWGTRIALRSPRWLVRLLRPILPTYVFRLERP